MGKISVSRVISAPASKVWETIADFNGMPTWHPAVTGSTIKGGGIGAERTLTIAEVGTIVESLDKLDDANMSFYYSATAMPLPIRNYQGNLEVVPEDENKCTVTWAGSFDADASVLEDMQVAVQGFYEAGLEGLKSTV